MKEQNANPKPQGGLFSLLRAAALLCAALAILCFATPFVRKSDALNSIGRRTVSELDAFSVAVSYYAAAPITAVSQNLATDAQYKELAGLLAQVSGRMEYQGLALLARGADKQWFYLVDAAYRDNGKAGTDYHAPGEQYAAEYKSVKTLADRIFSGKTNSGYTTDLVTRRDLRQVTAACLPIYGDGHAVLAVLVAEVDPGNTDYHLVGPLNLYYAGAALFGVFALLVLVLYLIAKRRRAKQQKSEQQAQEPAAQTEQAEPAPEAPAEPAAPPAEQAADAQAPVEPTAPTEPGATETAQATPPTDTTDAPTKESKHEA